MNCKTLVCLTIVFLIFCPGVGAEENIHGSFLIENYDSVQIRDYFHNFYRIPVSAGEEIFYPDEGGRQRNHKVLGALMGSFILDQFIRDFTREYIYSGDNLLSRFLYNVGTTDTVLLGFGGSFAWSRVSEDIYLEDTMLLSLQSLILTQLTTEVLKNTVKRVRPRNSPNDPFTRSSGSQSFISGHTSGTWAVMSVIAGRYPQKKMFAYGLATAVSVARIYEDAHWLSDVLAGAIVGYGFGRLTLDLNNSFERKLSLSPVIYEQGAGLYVSYQF